MDFLYKLGSGASMIRVRDLELQPIHRTSGSTAVIRLWPATRKSAVRRQTFQPQRQNENHPSRTGIGPDRP